MRCQFDCISSAISRWRDHSDKCCLVLDRLTEVPLSCANAKKVSNLEDSNFFQCKRKLGDGNFMAAIKVLSLFGVEPFSSKTLQALEYKHLTAPLPVLPSFPVMREPFV